MTLLESFEPFLSFLSILSLNRLNCFFLSAPCFPCLPVPSLPVPSRLLTSLPFPFLALIGFGAPLCFLPLPAARYIAPVTQVALAADEVYTFVSYMVVGNVSAVRSFARTVVPHPPHGPSPAAGPSMA